MERITTLLGIIVTILSVLAIVYIIFSIFLGIEDGYMLILLILGLIGWIFKD